MVIDREKMRAKLAEVNKTKEEKKKDRDKDNPWFKPAEGDQKVRFLPSADGDPFKTYHLHYNLGEPVLCPKKNFDEKCAICDYAYSLWKEGTDESKTMAKKFYSQERFFSNVIARSSTSDVLEPKPYSYGKDSYKQLLTFTIDPDYDDITDPELGRDFNLNYKKAETKGAFPKTTLVVGGKPTPISKNKKEIKELLDKVKPIEEFLLRKTSDEISHLLHEKMTESRKDNSEQQKYGDIVDNSITDIDSAIDELNAG